MGAGDTVTAGLAHHLLAGRSSADAFRNALAMGSASCLTLFPGEFHETSRQLILSQIQELDF
jgi:fructose-1-phosphate kinase PfkB-like protein